MMAKLLGQRSGTALEGQTAKHKHRAFTSQWKALLAMTCSLQKDVLSL